MKNPALQPEIESQWLSFRSFVKGDVAGVQFIPIVSHEDARGWLIELFRADEMPAESFPKMGYVSETRPHTIRGPHGHRQQTDYFAFLGPGDFLVSVWDVRASSATRGYNQRVVVGESNRRLVVIPPGIVHAYKNVSDHAGWCLNFPNQLYAGEGRKSLVDEIRFEEIAGHPFVLDE